MEQLDVFLIRLHSSLKSASAKSLVGKWIKRTASRDFKIAKEPILQEIQEQVHTTPICIYYKISTFNFPRYFYIE